MFRKAEKADRERTATLPPAKRQKVEPVEDESKKVKEEPKERGPVDPLEALAKLETFVSAEKKFPKAVSMMENLVMTVLDSSNAERFMQAFQSVMSSGHINKDGCRKAVQDLFATIQKRNEYFTSEQLATIEKWSFSTVIHNDLFTDDTYVFVAAVAKVQKLIDELPPASSPDWKRLYDMMEEPKPQYNMDTEMLDPLFRALETIYNSFKFAWARASVNQILPNAHLKRFIFKEEQRTQLEDWVAAIKSKSTKPQPGSNIPDARAPLEASFKVKDARVETFTSSGLDAWSLRQSGL
eukprot:GILI01019008.1.p1 GENE.GILI01019008.1~~GILI01019008.1.p1  ORF type:complete len:319 (-),score=63.77 GILI01019008.1:362-1249(-)